MLKRNSYSVDVKKIKYWAISDTFMDFYKFGVIALVAALALLYMDEIEFITFVIILAIHIVFLLAAILFDLKSNHYTISVSELDEPKEVGTP